MKTPALALDTREAPYCQAEVATSVARTPCPVTASQVTGSRSSLGSPCRAIAIGRMTAAATTTVTAGMAMAERTCGARLSTTSQARKISSDPIDSATPRGDPAVPGLPAISAAPAVAAATPIHEVRETLSPIR